MLTSNVKRIMEKNGVTVRAMMEGTGLSGETIMRARKDHIRQCRLDTLETIAKFLDCTVKELFDEG